MKDNYCIHNLLKFICLLQDNSIHACSSLDECQKPYLGPTTINPYYNTRVVSFYKKDGTLFTSNTSSYFRIMNMNENCATFLILEKQNNTFSSTGEYITIHLRCIGAVCCIQDICLTSL